MAGASTGELAARAARTRQTGAERAEQDRIFAACQDEFQRVEAAAADGGESMSECLRRPVRTVEEREQRDLECARAQPPDTRAPLSERHQNSLDSARRPPSDPGAQVRERQQRDLDRLQQR